MVTVPTERDKQMIIKLFIKRYAGETIWFSQFIDAPDITEVFGTNLLPTAFNSNADFTKVESHLQRHYPNATIVKA